MVRYSQNDQFRQERKDFSMSFKEIKPEELNFNPFTRIGSDWMLLTAGTEDKFNTMTASWGGVGELWGKYVSTIYIRPQRYTKEFVDQEEYFTLSFFGDQWRKALAWASPQAAQSRSGGLSCHRSRSMVCSSI